MNRYFFLIGFAILLAFPSWLPAQDQTITEGLAKCKEIVEEPERLICYDELAAPKPEVAEPPPDITRMDMIAQSCMGISKCLGIGRKEVQKGCSIQLALWQGIYSVSFHKVSVEQLEKMFDLALLGIPTLSDKELLIGQEPGMTAEILRKILPKVIDSCSKGNVYDRYRCKRKALKTYAPGAATVGSTCGVKGR